MKCYVETSLCNAIIHKDSMVSERIREETNFELTLVQAEALIDCNDGSYGPVWCGECFPDKSPSF